jgi:hypothetical protein
MGIIKINGKLYGGGSPGVRIRKLTQEQYDSLPDSKLSDGVLYAIIDDNTANSGSVAKPVELTKAQYEALGDSVLNDNILYAITDGDGLTAKGIEYDGSNSGLGSNVQDAIDNLNKKTWLDIGETVVLTGWEMFYAHDTNKWRVFIHFPFTVPANCDYSVSVDLIAIDSVVGSLESSWSNTSKYGSGVVLDFSGSISYGVTRMGQFKVSITRTK